MRYPKRLSTGKYIDLGNLKPEDIDLEDIDRSLNYIYRFTGHWKDKEPLTVAQHTWLVYSLAKEFYPNDKATQFNCILHDMPEAYYGDVATPLKRLFGDAYVKFARDIDSVVYSVLWKRKEPFDEEVETRTKICDSIALDIERRNMWSSQYGKKYWPPEPINPFNMNDKKDWFEEASRHRYIDLIGFYKEALNG